MVESYLNMTQSGPVYDIVISGAHYYSPLGLPRHDTKQMDPRPHSQQTIDIVYLLYYSLHHIIHNTFLRYNKQPIHTNLVWNILKFVIIDNFG